MPTEAEIEVVRMVIRDEIRSFWAAADGCPVKLDGYRVMARKALEAAERVRKSEGNSP